MSLKLANINIGDVITWSGKRIDASAKSETWQAQSIKKIEDGYRK